MSKVFPEIGETWRNLNTLRTCEIVRVTGTHGYVHLKHESGRKSTKGVHYFLYDYTFADSAKEDKK